MRFLLAVARAGGILAAADELRVTASAVSQQLTRLEREAGEALVNRTPHGTTLTAAGAALAEAAEDIERALNLVQARLEHDDPELRGTIRIGGFESILCTVIAPALPVWRTRFPRVKFELVEKEQGALLRALRARDLDMVILELDAGEASPSMAAGVSETPLLDEPWMLVVPEGTLMPPGMELSQLDLPWIGIDADSSIASTRAMQRVGHTIGSSRRTIHSYHGTRVALALVAAREGMTLIPALALRGIAMQGFDALEVPGLGMRRIVLRSYPRTKSMSEAVQAVTALIREEASEFSVTAGA